MDPYTLGILLREYHRVRADEDRRKQRRLDAALDANEVMAERATEGRFAAMLSRLRERWLHQSPRVSRPMEPSGA
jgi:hypothetical protein